MTDEKLRELKDKLYGVTSSERKRSLLLTRGYEGVKVTEEDWQNNRIKNYLKDTYPFYLLNKKPL